MSKFAIKIPWDPTVPWDTWDCPWESTVPPEDPHIPLSVLSHCTMGQVGLSMGVHCPTWGPPYPTVRPIPLYHGTGGTVHGSPLSHLRTPISHCPSYPTVPWDRWDCPWESTVPPEDPHITLSVLSHCTMGQVGLSMGVHCPTWGPPYHTVCPIPLYHGIGGTVHGSPLSHLRTPISHCPSYPTVPWDRWDCPWESTVPPEDPHITLSVLSHCTMGQVGLSMGVHCPTWRATYHTVCPIPLYHGTGGTVHGSPLSHLRTPISHCLSYPTVPWDRWDCPWESTVPPEDPHITLSVLSHCTMGQVGLSMGVHCPTWLVLSHCTMGHIMGVHCPVLSHCTMGQVGLSMGVHCPTWGPPYHTVRPIPLYHGTGGTVHGSPLSHLRTPISHCPSYPTVPWDRWDCPWESTVPPEDPHITLSVLSHCTMGQVGLSMGVHCPTWGPPYHTVRPIPLYHGTHGTVHGCQLTSHLRTPISHCPSYPTVPWDRWITVHGSPLSHLTGLISHCLSYLTALHVYTWGHCLTLAHHPNNSSTKYTVYL